MPEKGLTDRLLDAQRTLTIQEVVAKFNRSRQTIYDYTRRHGLQYRLEDGRRYFSATEVEAVIREIESRGMVDFDSIPD